MHFFVYKHVCTNTHTCIELGDIPKGERMNKPRIPKYDPT